MDKLTDQGYWEQGYRQHQAAFRLPDLRNFRELSVARIVDTLESTDLAGKRVLEVGAGDSTILLVLARRFAEKTRFAGLDYTDSGCELLRERSRMLGVDIEIIKADLFQPPPNMIGQFDVVYSLGLVEHFERLDNILVALERFLKPDGVIVTIIPNMHGVLGALTKRWNKAVYDLHNPHGLSSFLSGHAEAGLEVRSSGFLCSSNFGILSACFIDGRRSGKWPHKCLTGLTLLISWFESKFFELPKTAWLSPYIFAISSRNRRVRD